MSDKYYTPEVITTYPITEVSEPTYESEYNYLKSDVVPLKIDASEFPEDPVSDVIGISINTKARKILGEFSFGVVGSLRIGTYVNGTSGDISISPSGIVARNSSGVTTFALDGETGDADFIGTITASTIVSSSLATASSGARVLIFPDANTGIQAIDNASNDVFKILVGGTDVGDVLIGNYSGGAGILWDKSAGTMNIKGSMTAGSITGVTITGSTIKTASSGVRVELTASDSDIAIYDSGDDLVGLIDDTGTLLRIGSYDSRNMQILANQGLGVLDIGAITVSFNDADLTEVGSISMSGSIDMNGGDVNELDVLSFNTRSSNPSNSWCLYAYSSGGTHQLRVRLNGSTYSADLTSA